MKKIISFILVLSLCFAFVLPFTASAASASATLSGPSALRAGDTITLTFKLNGSGIYGASGTLSYDQSQLSFVKATTKIKSPWKIEYNGNNFLAYDDRVEKPINKSTELFTVTFKVKNVAVGTNIKVSYTSVTATDGSSDARIGTVSYSKTVAAPLSSENNLSSMTVSNATISPAFSASTTKYTAEVPFEVSKLSVSATAKDSKAKVKVNSPTLTPGGKTNVTVTVTAENGDKKTYTITVKRAQDPNYQASTDNALSSITVQGFLLSPVFDTNTTEYVVWLPYETESVVIGGIPADSKASVEVVGGEALIAGQDNEVKVVCTAESGDEKVYTVTVKRAAPHGQEPSDEPTDEPSDEPTDEPTDTPSDEPTDEPSDEPSDDKKDTDNGIAPWWIAVAGILGLLIGGALGFVIKKK